MAVAEARDRDPAEEVEILVAVDVPQPRPLAAHELDRHPRVGADHALTLELLQFRESHGEASIIVPIPAWVKTSSSSECAIRPSRMCAALTPASIASRQAASFGRMPPAWRGSSSRTRSVLARAIRLASSSGSASQPGTSVRKMTL